jgi:AcrR family transcriptional regulator
VIGGILEGPLPRGRHGLPRELVTANQRERILRATAEVFAEQGYASLVVSDVIARAGVSRATFYKLFADKRECVLVAQRWAFESLRESFLAACASRPQWPDGVVAAVGVALDFVAASPGRARLVLASEYASSEPALVAGGIPATGQFVSMLERGSRRCPAARQPRGLEGPAAVGAAMSIVGTAMSEADPASLPALKAEVSRIVLTPYIGAGEAARAAAG